MSGRYHRYRAAFKDYSVRVHLTARNEKKSKKETTRVPRVVLTFSARFAVATCNAISARCYELLLPSPLLLLHIFRPAQFVVHRRVMKMKFHLPLARDSVARWIAFKQQFNHLVHKHSRAPRNSTWQWVHNPM